MMLQGPQKIRDAGLRAVLSDLGWSIHDQGHTTAAPPAAVAEPLLMTGNMEMPVASHDDASAVMKNQSAGKYLLPAVRY